MSSGKSSPALGCRFAGSGEPSRCPTMDTGNKPRQSPNCKRATPIVVYLPAGCWGRGQVAQRSDAGPIRPLGSGRVAKPPNLLDHVLHGIPHRMVSKMHRLNRSALHSPKLQGISVPSAGHASMSRLAGRWLLLLDLSRFLHRVLTVQDLRSGPTGPSLVLSPRALSRNPLLPDCQIQEGAVNPEIHSEPLRQHSYARILAIHGIGQAPVVAARTVDLALSLAPLRYSTRPQRGGKSLLQGRM